MNETRDKCEPRDERPRLVEDVETLAERASSRGAQRRANDLRAVAEHLRAKEAREPVEAVVAGRPGRSGRALSRLRSVLGRSRPR